MRQGEENVPWFYTKENPNGLPDWKKDALGEWDARDCDTFLELKVTEFFNALEGASVTAPQEEVLTSQGPGEYPKMEPVQQPLIDDPDSDIPF